VEELRAARSIDVQGLHSLDEVLHLDFDAEPGGTVWLYRSGCLGGREESQIFRSGADESRFRLFAVPEALQRLPFRILRVGAGRLYLLGCPAAAANVPSGFALDSGGQVVCGFHLGLEPLDAVPAPGGALWTVGARGSGQPAARRLALELVTLEDWVGLHLRLDDWPAERFNCLALGEGRLLLGGVGDDGSTRVELCTSSGREPVSCPDVGRPLALGFGPRKELLCLTAAGQLVRLGGEGQEPGAAGALRLLDPQGIELGRIESMRFLYRRLYALPAGWGRILEFRL